MGGPAFFSGSGYGEWRACETLLPSLFDVYSREDVVEVEVRCCF